MSPHAEHAIACMVEALRLKHYSYNTEATYVGWARRFAEWLGSLRAASSEQKVQAFLTGLAKADVSSSTQNQAFNAILFFYQHGVGKPLLEEIKAIRARRPARIRTAPAAEDVARVLALVENLHGYPTKFLCHLLYAAGLRVSEAVNLRVRDLKVKNSLLIIRDGKGGKDRLVSLPCSLVPCFERQLLQAKTVFEHDRAESIPLQLPGRLRVKYPAWEYAWEWAWIFPQKQPCQDKRTGRRVRFHLHEANLQRAMKLAGQKAGISGLTPHHLRHAWATHVHRRGASLRDIQEHLGHAHLNTTMIYITPDPNPIRSPYEGLGLAV